MSVKCENHQEFSLKISASLLKCIQLLQIPKIMVHICSTPFIYVISDGREWSGHSIKASLLEGAWNLGMLSR